MFATIHTVLFTAHAAMVIQRTVLAAKVDAFNSLYRTLLNSLRFKFVLPIVYAGVQNCRSEYFCTMLAFSMHAASWNLLKLTECASYSCYHVAFAPFARKAIVIPFIYLEDANCVL